MRREAGLEAFATVGSGMQWAVEVVVGSEGEVAGLCVNLCPGEAARSNVLLCKTPVGGKMRREVWQAVIAGTVIQV